VLLPCLHLSTDFLVFNSGIKFISSLRTSTNLISIRIFFVTFTFVSQVANSERLNPTSVPRRLHIKYKSESRKKAFFQTVLVKCGPKLQFKQLFYIFSFLKNKRVKMFSHNSVLKTTRKEIPEQKLVLYPIIMLVRTFYSALTSN
jgi:hypothetical protein